MAPPADQPGPDPMLLTFLSCVACLSLPRQEFRNCERGHIMCTECTMKVKKCPTCRTTRLDYPNLLANHVSSHLYDDQLMACNHAAWGCKQEIVYKDIHVHEEACNFRETTCPAARRHPNSSCKFLGPRQDLLEHIKQAKCCQILQPNNTGQTKLLATYCGTPEDMRHHQLGVYSWNPIVLAGPELSDPDHISNKLVVNITVTYVQSRKAFYIVPRALRSQPWIDDIVVEIEASPIKPGEGSHLIYRGQVSSMYETEEQCIKNGRGLVVTEYHQERMSDLICAPFRIAVAVIFPYNPQIRVGLLRDWMRFLGSMLQAEAQSQADPVPAQQNAGQIAEVQPKQNAQPNAQAGAVVAEPMAQDTNQPAPSQSVTPQTAPQQNPLEPVAGGPVHGPIPGPMLLRGDDPFLRPSLPRVGMANQLPPQEPEDDDMDDDRALVPSEADYESDIEDN